MNPEDPLNGQLELTLVPGNDFSAGDQVCTADDLDAVASLLANNYTVEYTHSLEAPIVAGDIMGTLTYTSPITGEGFTATLIASRDIAAAPVSTLDFIAESLGLSTDSDDSSPRSLLWVLIPAGIVLLIIVITIISLVQRHRRKMRYMQPYAGRAWPGSAAMASAYMTSAPAANSATIAIITIKFPLEHRSPNGFRCSFMATKNR